MKWDQVWFNLLSALLPVLTSALIVLIGYGVSYVRKKAAQVDNQTVRDAFIAALGEAEKSATDAIYAVSQQFTEDLKAAKADGKLTDEEKKAAMEKAINYFKEHIKAESLDILQAAWGPIENWLKDLIEAKLGENKITKMANPLS